MGRPRRKVDPAVQNETKLTRKTDSNVTKSNPVPLPGPGPSRSNVANRNVRNTASTEDVRKRQTCDKTTKGVLKTPKSKSRSGRVVDTHTPDVFKSSHFNGILKDDLICSQHLDPGAEVGWDANSPDALRHIQFVSRSKRDEGDGIKDIVKKLAVQNADGPSCTPPLLGLWMNKDDLETGSENTGLIRPTRLSSRSCHNRVSGRQATEVMPDDLMRQLAEFVQEHEVHGEKGVGKREKSYTVTSVTDQTRDPGGGGGMSSPVSRRQNLHSQKRNVPSPRPTNLTRQSEANSEDLWGSEEEDLFNDDSFILKATQMTEDAFAVAAKQISSPRVAKRRHMTSTPEGAKPPKAGRYTFQLTSPVIENPTPVVVEMKKSTKNEHPQSSLKQSAVPPVGNQDNLNGFTRGNLQKKTKTNVSERTNKSGLTKQSELQSRIKPDIAIDYVNKETYHDANVIPPTAMQSAEWKDLSITDDILCQLIEPDEILDSQMVNAKNVSDSYSGGKMNLGGDGKCDGFKVAPGAAIRNNSKLSSSSHKFNCQMKSSVNYDHTKFDRKDSDVRHPKNCSSSDPTNTVASSNVAMDGKVKTNVQMNNGDCKSGDKSNLKNSGEAVTKPPYSAISNTDFSNDKFNTESVPGQLQRKQSDFSGIYSNSEFKCVKPGFQMSCSDSKINTKTVNSFTRTGKPADNSREMNSGEASYCIVSSKTEKLTEGKTVKQNECEPNMEITFLDDDDMLAEPEILAMLEEVESQQICQKSPVKRNENHDEVRVSQSLTSSQGDVDDKPLKCTPEQIEMKRQQAVRRRHNSQTRRNSESGCEEILSQKSVLSQGSESDDQQLPCTPEQIKIKRQEAIRRRHNSHSHKRNSKNDGEEVLSQNSALSPSSRSKDRSAHCNSEQTESKRQEAVCRQLSIQSHMRNTECDSEDVLSQNSVSSQGSSDDRPSQCTPEEIQMKKQEAIRRRQNRLKMQSRK